MLVSTIEELARYIIYCIILLCGWMVVSSLILPSVRKGRTYGRYKGAQKEDDSRKKRKNRFMRHIERTIRVAMNTRSEQAIYTFFLISGLLTFFSLLFCIRSSQTVLTSIITCTAAGGTPYLLLYMKLRAINVNSSYEADILVTELISQYKMNYLNMVEAIDQTIIRLKRDLYTRKALFRLSLDVKECRNREELEVIVKEFAFSIGTEWAILLSNNIYQAIAYRDDVREGLEDILNELIALKAVNETNKQNNSETFLIIKYVAPLAYLLSIYGLIHYLGFSTSKFIDYQFKNPQGLQYFVYTMVCIVANFIIYYFIRKPKNDF